MAGGTTVLSGCFNLRSVNAPIDERHSEMCHTLRTAVTQGSFKHVDKPGLEPSGRCSPLYYLV